MQQPRPGRDAFLFLIGGVLGLGLMALSDKDMRRRLGSGDYYTMRSRWRPRR